METKETGIKYDQDKIRPRLVLEDMASAISAVSVVATYGANKYTEGGWLDVPNADKRYTDAMYRHLLEHSASEKYDRESCLHHLAHVAWNALAVLELELRKGTSLVCGCDTVFKFRTGE